jgi:hypothetical protein
LAFSFWRNPADVSHLNRFSGTTIFIDTKAFFIFRRVGIRGHISNTIRLAALGARPAI